MKKTENMLETKTKLQQSDSERKSHFEVHDNSKSLTTLVPDDCGDSKYVIYTYIIMHMYYVYVLDILQLATESKTQSSVDCH